MRGYVLAFVFSVIAFQVSWAMDLKWLGGMEAGWSLLDSGIEDARGDSVPKTEGGVEKVLDHRFLWGGGLYGGLADERVRMIVYANYYGMLPEDKGDLRTPEESVREAVLRTYTVSPRFSYRAYATPSENLSLWLGTGYRYYVIHGILTLSNDRTGEVMTYENGYFKNHSVALGPTLELNFTPRVGVALAYERCLTLDPASSYYLTLTWKQRDPRTPGTVLGQMNFFSKLVQNRGHYGQLYIGLSGEVIAEELF